jgi:hypothetical protein
MCYKKILLSFLLTISSLLYAQEKIYSSEAYFTPYDIKRQILHAIEKSKDSIDIAVLDITSKDILHSLMKAQERGVHIRIVVNRKQSLSREPLSRLYQNQNKGFIIKVFNQKGIMRNNFAIFDGKLLITGSYRWNKNESKLTRDNAIFTDIAKVLVKYQKEFDHLFSKAVTPRIPATVHPAGSDVESVLPAALPESLLDEKQIITRNHGVIITETLDGYIDMNFEEFNTIFGMASKLYDEQKESLWHHCKGKRVKWNGRVNYIGWGLLTGWMMGVDYGDTNVEIKLNAANKKHFSKVNHGNMVTYTGKLTSRVTRVFPYKLEDGYVLDILDTEDPSPRILCPESIRNHDVIPISQGPKKIFIIKSFEDLDVIFGDKSNLTETEKDETWEKYVGKYVSWTGQIVYKNLNAASDFRIGIMQGKNRPVELKLGPTKKEDILKFQDGETIVYSGRLAIRCNDQLPYVLEDGKIVTLR